MTLKQIKEKFRKFLDPSSPVKLRMMAAEGLIPGTFAEQAGLSLLLLRDKDETVRKKAFSRLKSIPPQEWKKHLTSLGDDLLDLLVGSRVLPPSLVEEAIATGKLSKFGLRWAVKYYGSSSSVIEAVSKRQNALLEDQELVKMLLAAPGLTSSVKSYVEELTGITKEEPEVEKEESTEKAPPQESPPSEEKDEKAEFKFQPISAEDKVEVTQEEVPPAQEEVQRPSLKLKEKAKKEEDKKKKEDKEPLYKKLLRMSIPEKVRLAEIGGEDARSILIKDSNKLVALAVLRNPRLRDDEIVSIAASKNVIPEVLQVIASNRKWMKNYSVKLALVNNPKTPVHISMKILPQLLEKDLKSLKKNRNIPSAVLSQVKKILQQKEEKRQRKG